MATPVPQEEREVMEVVEVRTPRNKPPLIRGGALSPRSPTAADDLVASVEATDPEGLALDESFTWTLNGEVMQGYRDARVPAGEFKRGDQVSVSVVVSDGERQAEAVLGSVTIINANPVLETDLRQVRGLGYAPLRARDADGDSIQWRLEDAPEGLSIDASGVIRYKASQTAAGGSWRVKVVGDDGHGGWVKAEFPVTVSAGSEAGKGEAAEGGAEAGEGGSEARD